VFVDSGDAWDQNIRLAENPKQKKSGFNGTKISYRRCLYEPTAQPWTAEELNEMYESAKRRSFEDRFHIIREMEGTTDTTRTYSTTIFI